MDIKAFESFWNLDDTTSEKAPVWLKKRRDISKAFPSPYRANPSQPDPLALELAAAITKLDKLKPEKSGHGYLGEGSTSPTGPNYKDCVNAKLAPNMETISNVVDDAIDMFKGMPIWNHPLIMPNVIPPANIAAIIAATMTEVFSPNIIEGEYSWNVERGELESAAMVARLIGWDADKAGGLFTFGGSGCYLYGLKYALSRVFPGSRESGIRTDGKLLVSQQGHYCKLNSTDWTGLGMNNIIEIETDVNTNAMSMENLEKVMKQLHRAGTPIVSIVCTMGTTDANAIDPAGKVRELINKYPNPDGCGETFLYCDSVIGWAWLAFGKYDFDANPLGFSQKTLDTLMQNYDLIKEVKHADAVGCDFHKSGWSPYNCSLFMYKNKREFTTLMQRPGSDYLQERTDYNPGLYTLEVSRSGSYAMAGWATLKYFGYEGFQAVLGSILEMQEYLRGLIGEHSNMVCVNTDDTGYVTLFRIYPKGIDAQKQYQKELTELSALKELTRYNCFQEAVANKMWTWFRSGKEHHGLYAPYTSYSTGFRPTEYNREETNASAMIYALKSFPMNVNINHKSMQTVVRLALAAAAEVEKESEDKWDCESING